MEWSPCQFFLCSAVKSNSDTFCSEVSVQYEFLWWRMCAGFPRRAGELTMHFSLKCLCSVAMDIAFPLHYREACESYDSFLYIAISNYW